jgi:AraC-like DNA-binding protein
LAAARGFTLRRFVIEYSDGIRAALTHYASRTAHARHRHSYAQISFLLAGSLCESHQGAEFPMHGTGIGYKPAGHWHSDEWGAVGTLIFSVNLSPDSAHLADSTLTPGWSRPADCDCIPGVVRACLRSADEESRNEAILDALAIASQPKLEEPGVACGLPGLSRAPAWLERVREQMLETPALVAMEEAARAGGVHRVHLSRVFSRFYGMPPSVFRLRAAAARAIGAIAADGASLTRVAHDTGFSDHAHMTRTLRAQIGLGPAELRRLLSG